MFFKVLFISLAFLSLILTGCGPMAGSMKLIDQSLPKKPEWTSKIPQSRTNEYFVGMSDNRPSIDEAKKDNRSLIGKCLLTHRQTSY